MTQVFAFIGGAIAIVAGAIFKGYTLSVLWGWFVVPTFAVPALPVAAAIGIGYIAHLLGPTVPADPDIKKLPQSQQTAVAILRSFLVSGMALLFGRLVLAFS